MISFVSPIVSFCWRLFYILFVTCFSLSLSIFFLSLNCLHKLLDFSPFSVLLCVSYWLRSTLNAVWFIFSRAYSQPCLRLKDYVFTFFIILYIVRKKKRYQDLVVYSTSLTLFSSFLFFSTRTRNYIWNRSKCMREVTNNSNINASNRFFFLLLCRLDK